MPKIIQFTDVVDVEKKIKKEKIRYLRSGIRVVRWSCIKIDLRQIIQPACLKIVTANTRVDLTCFVFN